MNILKKKWNFFTLFIIFGFLNGTIAFAEIAILTTAPNVPPVIKRDKAETVVINLQAKEYVGNLTKYVK